MKTCSSCGELNGDGRDFCWKCSKVLPESSKYKKICPTCRSIYQGSKSTCPTCHVTLAIYDDPNNSSMQSAAGSDGCWMYAVAILIPMVGIILGLIYIARQEDDLGKSLILTSVGTSVLWLILSIGVSGCFAGF